MADVETPVEKCSKCQKRKAKYTIDTCSHTFCNECFYNLSKESIGVYIMVTCHCGTSQSFKKQK